ncbi:glycosyltransferase family 2 protein [Desulfococcaceae bacterium HSG7]|nr:glycosyltransferase family 2 protein [Desulfococcaceae bacterium HSG7]
MKVSIVSPFYNESLILEKSVELMISNLSALQYDWEFIMVNDGSCDGSLEIARRLAQKYKKNVRLISYSTNQGRGYALKRGIDAAVGDIIVTTEIDSSWGDSIVKDLVAVFAENPSVDMVIASPHLVGGGYRNVPLKRVFLSRWGNQFIRFLVSKKITMFTGMTRAYRVDVIKNLPVMEKGKEFHLEVVLKALSFGCRINEIPCILEWRDDKFQTDTETSKQRTSSSNINKLIASHLFFGIMARPVRYLWGAGIGFGVTGLLFFGMAVVNLIIGGVAIFFALSSASLITVAVLFFIFGVLTTQNSLIQKEMWKIQQDIKVLGEFHKK